MADIMISLHGVDRRCVNEGEYFDTGTGISFQSVRYINVPALAHYYQRSNLQHSAGTPYSGTPLYFANIVQDALSIGAGFLAPNDTDRRSGCTAGVMIKLPPNMTLGNPEPALQLVRVLSEAYEGLLISDGVVHGERTEAAFKDMFRQNCPVDLIKEIGASMRPADRARKPFGEQRGLPDHFEYAYSLSDEMVKDRDVLTAAAFEGLTRFLQGNDPDIKDSIIIGSATDISSLKDLRVIIPVNSNYAIRLPLRTAASHTTAARAVAAKTPKQGFGAAAAEVLFPVTIIEATLAELGKKLEGPDRATARDALTKINQCIVGMLGNGGPQRG